jgi:ATP-dependent protease Clp ATPase subunit
MSSWSEEMFLHEIDMVVDDTLVDYIVVNALKKETGGRSVETVFSQLMEDAAFEAYSSRKARRLILNLDQGRPGYRIER